MNPTAAETENGMPRSHKRDNAAGQRQRHGAEHQQRIARGAERCNSSRKIRRSRPGTTIIRRCRAAARFSNCPPQVEPVARRQLHLLARSSPAPPPPREPMSRPRTLAVTTTRRLPFSRLIWLGPSVNVERRHLPQRDGHAAGARAPRAAAAPAGFRARRCRRAAHPGAAPRSGNAGRPRTPARPPARRWRCRSRPARPRAQAPARDLRLVDLDLQNGRPVAARP